VGLVDHNPESSSGERHQDGGLTIFVIRVGGGRSRDFGGVNGQRMLQLPSGFTFIDGLRKRIGSEIGKDFPVDDLPAIALELIKEIGVAPRYRVLSKTMVRLMGWFNPLVGEVYEMLYQNDSPYLFDSSKFEEPSVSPARPTPKEFAPQLPLSRKLPCRQSREGLPDAIQH
jgi:hypothetical protein